MKRINGSIELRRRRETFLAGREVSTSEGKFERKLMKFRVLTRELGLIVFEKGSRTGSRCGKKNHREYVKTNPKSKEYYI